MFVGKRLTNYTADGAGGGVISKTLTMVLPWIMVSRLIGRYRDRGCNDMFVAD
jgi:hypothetical protein